MTDEYQRKWVAIAASLQTGLRGWRERIASFRQVAAVEARIKGHVFADDEILRGLIFSVLSNSTDWAIVEPVLPQLADQCCNFQLELYAALHDDDVKRQHDWFLDKRAGSAFLFRGLKRLKDAAIILLKQRALHGSLDQYFRFLLSQYGDVCSVAVVLGGYGAENHKLPGLGIPLAAEFLKNIGFDVAKPDRHINRAVGSFGWVKFKNWRNRQAKKAPIASQAELVSVMREMAKFSEANGLPVCYVDNAVWLLCAKSGLSVSNDALALL